MLFTGVLRHVINIVCLNYNLSVVISGFRGAYLPCARQSRLCRLSRLVFYLVVPIWRTTEGFVAWPWCSLEASALVCLAFAVKSLPSRAYTEETLQASLLGRGFVGG